MTLNRAGGCGCGQMMTVILFDPYPRSEPLFFLLLLVPKDQSGVYIMFSHVRSRGGWLCRSVLLYPLRRFE